MSNHTGGLSWFGQHPIARHQSRRNLSRENSQREIPRADTGENTITGRLLPISFRRIISQEIDGLAQLANTIRQGFASFMGQQSK